jgi:hypothetical protein
MIKDINYPNLYFIQTLKYDYLNLKWKILNKVGLACIFSTNENYTAYSRYRDNCNDLSEAT